jgi:hypothetical protein
MPIALFIRGTFGAQAFALKRSARHTAGDSCESLISR